MRKNFGRRRVAFPFILITLAFVALFSFTVMLLWNAILSPVLNISIINFWQSLGILVLAKILLGFPGGWRGRHHWGWNKEWNREMFEKRKEMMEKWHTMTPEEREKFKEEWRSRCRNRGSLPKEQKQENAENDPSLA